LESTKRSRPPQKPWERRAAAAAQVVREHYLRDDIWSGSPWDPESDPACNKLAADAREYLVVDTNVVLQQARSSA